MTIKGMTPNDIDLLTEAEVRAVYRKCKEAPILARCGSILPFAGLYFRCTEEWGWCFGVFKIGFQW